jgi:hypothetical protein
MMIPSPTNNAPLHRTIGAGYVTEIHFVSPAALDHSLDYFNSERRMHLSLSPLPTRIAPLFTFTPDLPNQRDNVVNGPTRTQLHAHVGHQQSTGSADVHCIGSFVAHVNSEMSEQRLSDV